ncbi:hypothetical protein E2562_024435 [Oryza meyeriana var. granulata]|uniref:Uncharacterized protein n=1 Tax=Oryza meyeriana var. granulata TaxID=110450 RepID=A0A6G1EYS9_9ORYZ|nr:hypothetical protein E2562_024435 [Oryza meyeriana var. granulata]KAF0929746.1 hypothetical protein E2562_024435 [Oryza meyeriana var. granulata]
MIHKLFCCTVELLKYWLASCDVKVQSLIEEEGFQFISKRARGGSQALGSCLDIVEVFSTTSRSADLHARYQFTKTMLILFLCFYCTRT